MIATAQVRTCDVCRLVDYDTTPKLTRYCPLCDAWICDPDQSRWDRRLRAAIKRKLEPGYKGQADYDETIAKDMKHD